MRARLIVVLCLLLSALQARGAGIEKFVDDHTLLAGQADLTKADPEVIDKWISETFKAANLMAPATVSVVMCPAPHRMPTSAPSVKRRSRVTMVATATR